MDNEIVYETEDYKIVLGESVWKNDITPPGCPCYLVINKRTGVSEGEGVILSRAIQYALTLQEELDTILDRGAMKANKPARLLKFPTPEEEGCLPPPEQQ